MPSRSRTTPQDNHANQKYGPPMPPVDGSPSPRPSRATKFASVLSRLINSFVRRLRRKETKRLQQPASNILTVLPIELIIEVMRHLGCREVLRLRQTCELLRALSTTRLVWENLVQRTALDSEVPLKLERPIKLYSAVQLEGLALQWRRVDLGWTRPPERLQVPQRDIRTNGAVNFYLVEGVVGF
ncbi:hypothetical protein BDZ97DRAFT_1811367 [Flammula alnicola]|nr:hypothetical protein BDZ97DRAFT_1811367 [Flammula alnicola]